MAGVPSTSLRISPGDSRRQIGSTSRMVGLALQVGIHQLVALRLAEAVARGLDGHEHRVDFVQDLWIVVLEDPALLRLIVRIKHPQAPRALAWALFLAPNAIVVTCVLDALVAQVVCVKQKRLALAEKNPTEGRPRLALRVGVEHVHDMKI